MEGLYDLSCDWTADGLALRALRRGDDGSKSVEVVDAPMDPYCYIRSDDLSLMECRRYDVRTGGDAPEGFVRIEADSPGDIRDYSDRVAHQTFESDVDYATRVLVDRGWGIAQPSGDDVLYFDIEVDDRGEFAKPGDAPDRVISIAAVGGDGRELYVDGDDEREQLEEFVRFADEYMLLVGWNSLGYDFEYLDNRALIHGMDVDWGRWCRLDMMPLYDMLARPTETLSLKLGDTAEREFGVGKADGEVSPGGGALWEAWEERPGDLEEYNMRDADILRQLDEKYGILELMFVICDICGVPPEDTCYESKYGEVKFAPGQAVDAHILSCAHERGVPLPDKGRYETHGFPGADVLDPEPGFYDKVATLDYSGMYPNIVRAFNFGPTTWYEDRAQAEAEEGEGVELVRGENGVFVAASERRSIMADAVDELVEMREGARDIIDRGVKVINNTLYGVCATPYHRYYKPGMSENITLIGQRLVRLAEEGARESPDVDRVVYGDTDSVMVLLDHDDGDPRDLVDAASRAVDVTESVLQSWADERGADGSYLMLDVDDVYRKFYIGDKKKRYFGHRLWKGHWSNDVKIKGLETVQGDVPRPCRDMQRELIDARLFGGSVGGIVSRYKERLRSGDLDLDMATLKGLGKPPSEYEAETPPVHVRAALAIREEFGGEAVDVGNKVGYIKYGDETQDWTWVHDGRMGRKLRAHDYDYLWEERFKSVMESIGVSEHDQSTLGEWAAA